MTYFLDELSLADAAKKSVMTKFDQQSVPCMGGAGDDTTTFQSLK